MIKHEYRCETCENTKCWVCKGNAYYDKVMSVNTYDAKPHKEDIGLIRGHIELYGCMSHSKFIGGKNE